MVGVAHAPAAHVLASAHRSLLAPLASRPCSAQPCPSWRNDAALGSTWGPLPGPAAVTALHSPPGPWRSSSTRVARAAAPNAAQGTPSLSAACAATASVRSTTCSAAAGAADAAGASRRPPAAVVLGIESSCDDTAVAVVTSDGRVLGEAIAAQADIVAQWGGVVPNLARDAHAAAIDRTVDLALRAAGLQPQQLSAIAVTIGPGLGLCLRVGAAKARDMSRQYGIPLVSVHHMEAHALVARLPPAAAAGAAPAVRVSAAAEVELQQQASSEPSSAAAPSLPVIEAAAGAYSSCSGRASDTATPAAASTSQGSLDAAGAAASSAAAAHVDAAAVLSDVSAAAAVPFPFLCLLVSGGHNLLVLVRGVGQYVQLGTSVDDALGEAYDKIARLLGLDLRPHGGAALEALAREGDPTACKFAVPMRQHATCDFSFAGLKTNTRLAIEQQLAPEAVAAMTPEHLRKVKAGIAASFQAVAVLHLVEKTRRGVAWARELAPELRQLVVAGGVACNQVVRSNLQALADKESLELVLPPPRWCTDNGVMVAWTGIERLALGWAEPPPPPLPRPLPAHTPSSPAAAAFTATSAPAAHPGAASHAADATTATQQPNPLAPGAAEASTARPAQEQEWLELKPRWPLTGEMHPRTAAARLMERRSVKRVRLHTPLSDLTRPSVGLAGAAGPEVARVGAATAQAGGGIL